MRHMNLSVAISFRRLEGSEAAADALEALGDAFATNDS